MAEDHRTAKAEAKASKAHAKALRPWYKKKRYILALAVVAIVGISMAASGGGDKADNGDKASVVASDATVTTAAEDATLTTAAQAPAPTEAPESKLTGPQKNAVRSAKNYLSLKGFSRQGLIDQLSSEYGDGFSVADATVAVDSLDVDWNEQAVKSAKNYLSLKGFSCQGLIDQLSSQYGDKFTVEEATYGAHQTEAC